MVFLTILMILKKHYHDQLCDGVRELLGAAYVIGITWREAGSDVYFEYEKRGVR
jgi:hypothetical protein